MNRLTPPSLPSLPHLRGVQQRHSVLDLSSIPALSSQASLADDNGLAQASPTSGAAATGSTNVGSRVPGRRAVASKRKPGPPMRTTGAADGAVGITAPISLFPEGLVASSPRQEIAFPSVSPTRSLPEATPVFSATASREPDTAVVDSVAPDCEARAALVPAESPQVEVKKTEPVVYVVSKPFSKDCRSIFDPIVTHSATALFTPLFHRCIRFLQAISADDCALEYRCSIRGFDVPSLDAALQADVDAAADELRSHLSNEAKQAILQSITELNSMYESYLGTLGLLETTDQCLMRLMYEAQQSHRRIYLQSSQQDHHQTSSDNQSQLSNSTDNANKSEATSAPASLDTVLPPSLDKLEYAWDQIHQLTKRQIDLCGHLEAAVEKALRVVLDTMNLLGAEYPDFIAPLSSLVAFVPNPSQTPLVADCKPSNENKSPSKEVKAVESDRSVSAHAEVTEVSAMADSAEPASSVMADSAEPASSVMADSAEPASSVMADSAEPASSVMADSAEPASSVMADSAEPATSVMAEVAESVAPLLGTITKTEGPVADEEVPETEVNVGIKAVEAVIEPAIPLTAPALRGQLPTSDIQNFVAIDVNMVTPDTAGCVSQQLVTETLETCGRIEPCMTATTVSAAAAEAPTAVIESTDEPAQEVSTPPLTCFFTPTGPSDEAQAHWEPTAEVVVPESADLGGEARAQFEPIREVTASESNLPVPTLPPIVSSSQST